MPKGWRPCPKPHCPEPTPPDQRFCDQHMVEYEKQRGTTTQRGYGHAHQQQRERWEPRVRAGLVTCWRCKQPITPDQAWDLGHHDTDRSKYQGPEHANGCNRAAAGRQAHNPPPF